MSEEMGTALSAGTETESAPVETTEAESAPASYSDRIWSDTGEVREDYGEVLKEMGVENASGVFRKYKTRDDYLKGTLNAHALASKRIDQWTEQEINSLAPEARENLAGKINGKPDSPESYKFDFAGENLHPKAQEFWAPKLHEAGLSQSQLEALLPALDEWHGSLVTEGGDAQQQQTRQQQLETKEHFESEWGDRYSQNALLVESFATDNLDPENPVHAALVNDKKGIEMIYRLATAEMQGRSEGKAPVEDGTSTLESPREELDRLVRDNPKYHESPTSSAYKRIVYLGKVLNRQGA